MKVSKSVALLGEIPNKYKKRYKENGRADWIGVQEKDPTPIVYFSGTCASNEFPESAFVDMAHMRFRCLSYAYSGPGSPLFQKRFLTSMKFCMDNNIRVFLDSGGYTFHEINRKIAAGKAVKTFQNKEFSIESYTANYVKYLKAMYGRKDTFDFYVGIDSIKQCKIIYEDFKELESTGVRPIPVYHGDAPIDWVQRYIDEGHRIIGIGLDRLGKSNKFRLRQYYSHVLNYCEKRGVKCHGFAVTGDLMFEFPFYSVDSTSWVKAAAYGKIIDWRADKHRVALIHVSNESKGKLLMTSLGKVPKQSFRELRERTEALGFDLELLQRSFHYRCLYNARVTNEAITQNQANLLKWKNWGSVLDV